MENKVLYTANADAATNSPKRDDMADERDGPPDAPVQLDLEEAIAALKGWSAKRSSVIPFRRRSAFRTVHTSGARHLYPFAASDFVTLLTAAGKSRVLTKRISMGSDGNPVLRDYDQAKRFIFEKIAVGGLSDLARAIDGVGSNTAVVLGEPTDAAVMGARRLAYDRPESGERATLAATAHLFLPIDLDSVPCPEGLDPIADPEAVVQQVVRNYLPAEMQDRDLYWQLTSSAGFKPGIRLRLFFWLDRPLECEAMKQWLGELDYVDASIYTPNQLIYAAKPIFAKNITDPVPRRSGICRGTYRAVSPPDPILAPQPQPGREGPKHNDFEGAANGARGYAYWCKRIGDHADGEGFHEPIKKAIGAYVGATKTVDTELLRAQLVHAIRAAPRDPSVHPDSYIEKQIRDLPGLIKWTQELEAQQHVEKPEADRAEVSADQNTAVRVSQCIAEINETFAIVEVGNHVKILREYTDDAGLPVFSLLSLGDFRLLVADRFITLPDKGKVPVAPLWLTSPSRRRYTGITFAPETSPQAYYNLWRGFAVAPSKDGSCERFKAHLRDNVCQGNEEHFHWVFGWFAHIIKHPAEKCGTSLVLRGNQGVGKTIVGETFGHLLSRLYYIHVAEPRYVTGRFNAHLLRCLLLHADEAFWAGDHTAEGKLKDLVTGRRHPIEWKGLEVVFVPNYVRLLVSGNADWQVPAGMRERRFAVLDVGETHIQDTQYFKAIVEELEAGGYERLMYELLDFDLSQVNLRVIPKTQALLEQKMESLPLEQKWWLDTLENGQLPHGDLPPNRCVKELLFADYTSHAQKTGVKRRSLDTQLGKFLKRCVPGLTYRQETYRGRVLRVYTFPSLAECRAAFERELHQEIPWDGPEEWVSTGGVIAPSLTELYPAPLHDLPPED